MDTDNTKSDPLDPLFAVGYSLLGLFLRQIEFHHLEAAVAVGEAAAAAVKDGEAAAAVKEAAAAVKEAAAVADVEAVDLLPYQEANSV